MNGYPSQPKSVTVERGTNVHVRIEQLYDPMATFGQDPLLWPVGDLLDAVLDIMDYLRADDTSQPLRQAVEKLREVRKDLKDA